MLKRIEFCGTFFNPTVQRVRKEGREFIYDMDDVGNWFRGFVTENELDHTYKGRMWDRHGEGIVYDWKLDTGVCTFAKIYLNEKFPGIYRARLASPIGDEWYGQWDHETLGIGPVILKMTVMSSHFANPKSVCGVLNMHLPK